MKAFHHILILVSSFIFCSCNKIEEPLLYTYITPFGKGNLENDISMEKDKLPKKIKRIIQYKGDTILNIVEYDNKGNEIFKLYKQYVHERWNGKYVTMIIGNVYKGEKLLRTYYFHSNIGFSLFSYDYGMLSQKINVKDIKGNPPSNSNQFKKIDTLRSLTDLLNHKMTDSLNNLSVTSYALLRKHSVWSNTIEEEYISEKESNKRMYYYDDQNRLIKEQWPSGHVNLYNYGTHGLISYYDIYDNKDTTRVKKISYNKEGLVDTLTVDGWKTVYQYRNSVQTLETTFNGNICIQVTNTDYNTLGYPTLVRETDCSGKITKENNYHYSVEYYK